MLRTLENILGSRLVANHCEIGTVCDFFLDDWTWRPRFLMVETDTWRNRRAILVAPVAFVKIDGETPAVDLDKPVSRQRHHEANELRAGGGAWC